MAALLLPVALTNGARRSRVCIDIREAAVTAALLSICLPFFALALMCDLWSMITERAARQVRRAVVDSARHVA
jgi:hypothetical protein